MDALTNGAWLLGVALPSSINAYGFKSVRACANGTAAISDSAISCTPGTVRPRRTISRKNGASCSIFW